MLMKGGPFMDVLSNSFERKWFAIFMFLYFVIMVPFPFFYSTHYVPSIAGLPLFIIGWTIHSVITFIAILVFYRQAMSREEYMEFGTES